GKNRITKVVPPASLSPSHHGETPYLRAGKVVSQALNSREMRSGRVKYGWQIGNLPQTADRVFQQSDIVHICTIYSYYHERATCIQCCRRKSRLSALDRA